MKMQEIKFRGKLIEVGEWIYGDLFHDKDCFGHITASYIYEYDNAHGRCFQFEVDPNTVGRYYGLPDKNTKDIYEGDIISLVNEEGKSINVICEFGTARREIFGNTVDITGFYFKLPNGTKSFPIVNNYAGKHDLELFEVIGTIHDNKEEK